MTDALVKLLSKVGSRIKYDYLAPAVSCEWNGRHITGEGVVVVIEDSWVTIDKWGEGEVFVRVRPSEITHVRRWWRWRKLNHG